MEPHKGRFRGSKLRDMRKAFGLNQKQFDDKLGIGFGSTSRAEQERLFLPDESERKVCEFFKVDYNFFRRD